MLSQSISSPLIHTSFIATIKMHLQSYLTVLILAWNFHY